jgi:hypothetical protein
MCTATIVVSLPTLKAFLISATPSNTSKRSITSDKNKSYGKPVSNYKTSGLHVQACRINDDEVELVSQCHGIHPRSLDTDWNQACTAGSSTTPIPILISPDDYPITERTHTSI